MSLEDSIHSYYRTPTQIVEHTFGHTHTHFPQIDNDGLHDLNVQANWQEKGSTYWVRFINIDLIGGMETSGAANFKQGDKVRVKRSVITPKYVFPTVSFPACMKWDLVFHAAHTQRFILLQYST